VSEVLDVGEYPSDMPHVAEEQRAVAVDGVDDGFPRFATCSVVSRGVGGVRRRPEWLAASSTYAAHCGRSCTSTTVREPPPHVVKVTLLASDLKKINIVSMGASHLHIL